MSSASANATSIEPLDFNAVYASCFPSVWKTLGRLGVPSAQLEDASQEVFIAIHRRLSELRDPTRVKAWATSFAVRAASDVRRSLRRRGTSEPIPDSLVAKERTDASTDQRDELAALRRVLDQLGDEQREVFVLIELEELTGPEAAEALAINLNTVYSRLRLARAAFEKLVDALEDAP